MDRHVPHEERMQRVEEVMRELGLKKCEKTLIGVQGRIKGISGKVYIFFMKTLKICTSFFKSLWPS